MVAPRYRSRTFRRVKRVVPGGRVALHYHLRKPGKAHCSECGKPLGGVPRLRPIHMSNLPKTQKRPERPYGGQLCHACVKDLMVAKARAFQ